jgi:hypothetical protein
MAQMPLYDPAGLEALRPSPEPDLFGQEWALNPVFKTSPPDEYDHSSGSGSNLDHPASDRLVSGSVRVRQDSHAGLRMGLGGLDLDLDSVFSGTDGMNGATRWA